VRNGVHRFADVHIGRVLGWNHSAAHAHAHRVPRGSDVVQRELRRRHDRQQQLRSVRLPLLHGPNVRERSMRQLDDRDRLRSVRSVDRLLELRVDAFVRLVREHELVPHGNFDRT
jgi:hypothetical protein